MTNKTELEEQIKTIESEIGSRTEEAEKLKSQMWDAEKNAGKSVAKKVLADLYSEDKKAMRENRDKIMEKLAGLSDAEKLTVGSYLGREGVIGGCNGFGGYKNPTTCGGCHQGERNVKALGLEKYVKFVGDRCYRIPEEIFKNALKELGADETKTLGAELEKIEQSALEFGKKKFELKRVLEVYEKLEKGGINYDEALEKMPEFVNLIKSTPGNKISVCYATAKLDENVGVILTGESRYYGSGGCEYGVSVIVFRDGETKDEYFKWRDPYDQRKDDHSLYFKEAEIVGVTNDEVRVRLKSSEYETVKTFGLKKSESKGLEGMLNEEDQEKFTERFETEKERLLKAHYRENATMPDYINFRFYEGRTLPQGTATARAVPYDAPQIVEEYSQPEKGAGVFVIKAQIDHDAGRGKQFEWAAYRVTGKDTSMIERDCAYEINLKEGKRIEINARDLLKKSQ